MAEISTDRLVRKEVALGTIRDIPPPENHIGLSIAPFLSVESDDVIFQYALPDVTSLAPARSEDAEAELAFKDESVGTGRAAVVDWAIKDHYKPSDVSRYRELTRIAEIAAGGSFPLTVGSITEGFQDRVARDTRARRRKLDNRIEWLIMTGLFDGSIAYNDGRIKFTVSYGRPAGQHNQAPTGGLWNLTTSDPIGALLTAKDYMRTTYGVTMTRAITSERVIRSVWNSSLFAARSGIAGTAQTTVDPRYVIDGWDYGAAVAVVERATGITIEAYDSVYRSRALGSTTVVNNRFTADDKILLLPSEGDIAELSDTQIGFAKTLTAPHPEGNWASGYYEWERDTVDPWSHDMGTGIKAFPVFPHLEYTYTLDVL